MFLIFSRVLRKDVFIKVVFNYVCECWISVKAYVQTWRSFAFELVVVFVMNVVEVGVDIKLLVFDQ